MTAPKLPPHQLPGWPRLLSQPLAAAYLCFSEGLFVIGVNSGLWPQPLTFRSRKVWDRAQLDQRVDVISNGAPASDLETRKRQYEEKQRVRALHRQRVRAQRERDSQT